MTSSSAFLPCGMAGASVPTAIFTLDFSAGIADKARAESAATPWLRLRRGQRCRNGRCGLFCCFVCLAVGACNTGTVGGPCSCGQRSGLSQANGAGQGNAHSRVGAGTTVEIRLPLIVAVVPTGDPVAAAELPADELVATGGGAA